jgi:hypothetical protein
MRHPASIQPFAGPTEPVDSALRATGGKNLPSAMLPVKRGAARSSGGMTAWRALAGAATVGQGRKPRSGGASRDSLDGLALVRPLRGKRSCLHLGKIWADGARIVDALDTFSKTYGRPILATSP